MNTGSPLSRSSWRLLLICLVCVQPVRAAWSSFEPVDPVMGTLQAKLTEVEAQSDLEEGVREDATAAYRTAIQSLERARVFSGQTAEFRRLAGEAPQLLATIRSELEQPPTEPSVGITEGLSLAQLEQNSAQAAVTLQAARQTAADLLAESTRRNEQRAVLTERLVRAKQELNELQLPTVSNETVTIDPVVVEARRAAHQAMVYTLQREVESIESELSSYDARRDLLPARRDRAQRRMVESQKLVEAWQKLIAEKRQANAEQAALEANRLRIGVARQHPVLKEYADETSRRATERISTQGAQGNAELYARRLAAIQSDLTELNTKFASVKSRLDASGLNRATGLLLRHHYESIPNLKELRKEIESAQGSLEDLDYNLIELQEERDAAGDIDRVAQLLLSRISQEDLDANREELQLIARELASSRRDLLDQLNKDGANEFEKLLKLNSTLRDFVEKADTYKRFIEERILWVRSIADGRRPRLVDLSGAVDHVSDRESWAAAWSITRASIIERRTGLLFRGVLLVALFILSRRCCRVLRLLGERVSRYSTDSFRYTIWALVLTVVIASPVAAVLFVAGRVLAAPEGQSPLAMGLGTGLQAAALYLYPLAFFRHLLRPGGLALAHFKWAKESVRPIRSNLRWFTPLIVPLVLMVSAVDSYGGEAVNASVGRMLFTLQMITLSVLLHCVLRPGGPLHCRAGSGSEGGWVFRLRYIWYAVAVLLPVFFIVLSWLGYYYTAIQLQTRLEQTLVLVLLLVVASDTLHRWLYVARRRVAVEDAKRRRAMAEAGHDEKSGQGEPVVRPAVLDEEKVDLPVLSGQTRQLFRTAVTVTAIIGFFVIWAQVLPALRMFDRLQVWPTVRVLEADFVSDVSLIPEASAPEESTIAPSPMMVGYGAQDVGGDGEGEEETRVLSITAADIGLSLIVLAATWVAFRNVPGLIEIVVLQRLPLDAGSRYALSTVLRYMIAIVGVAFAFQTVNIPWSSVQWLAAALTFGLAFGLQEIFANFVSGLIILAERPIRLGDTVTVGGVTGTVMRIRMRATTIADWDRKELVIPNKTFITGDVINWSLTDSVLRVRVVVGVSYSSDVDLVEKMLMRIAERHSDVLGDPAPQVIFKSFGESSLDFELRVFVSNIEYFVPVRHKLHNTIFKEFREAGIEIAFPQRDLHLRSVGELAGLVTQRPSGS